MKTKIARIILIGCLFNTSACGFFLYPERVGQNSGKIDPAVVILDAAGLLFGILPGVVAFAVDLSTGAIYLPPGEKSTINKHTERLGHLNNSQMKPADDARLPSNIDQVAQQLSLILDKPVEAASIKYFEVSGVQVSMSQAILR